MTSPPESFCKQTHVTWCQPMLFQCKKKYTDQFWSLFIVNYHINIDLLHMMLEGWISLAVCSRFVLQRSMKDEKTRQIFGPEFAKLWSFRVLDWISEGNTYHNFATDACTHYAAILYELNHEIYSVSLWLYSSYHWLRFCQLIVASAYRIWYGYAHNM